MKIKTKGKLGIGFAIASIGGVIYTVYLTAKKAPEAQKAKEAALQLKREMTGDPNAQLTRMESFKAQFKFYAPVAFSTFGVVSSIALSQVLPQDALNKLDKVHEAYKEVNEKMNGKEAAKAVEKMAEQKLIEEKKGASKEIFVLKSRGREFEFESTLLDVMEAEYEVNRYFTVGNCEMTFNQFLDIFKIPEHTPDGDTLGWQDYLGEIFYGYSWIDFTHRKGMRNGRQVTFIDLPFDCHPLNEEECDAEITSCLANHGVV